MSGDRVRLLILEDNPQRMDAMKKKIHGDAVVVVVETVEQAKKMLAEHKWDIVSLDHDLGGQEMLDSGLGTGYEVALWLKEHPEHQPPEIWLHSLNPVGRKNMANQLPNADECPFWWK